MSSNGDTWVEPIPIVGVGVIDGGGLGEMVGDGELVILSDFAGSLFVAVSVTVGWGNLVTVKTEVDVEDATTATGSGPPIPPLRRTPAIIAITTAAPASQPHLGIFTLPTCFSGTSGTLRV
jgi:hypothetical protein